jgi:hypothetical protein
LKLETWRKTIAAAAFIIGILFLGFGVGGMTLALTGVQYGFNVVDSVTGKPVVGALVTISGTFPPGGTVPFDATTDSNGFASVSVASTCLPVVMWGVSAGGYVSQGSRGSPSANPLTVHLVSSSPGSPPQSPSNSSDTNSSGSAPAPNVVGQIVQVGVGVFMLFLGVVVLVKKPR